MTKKLVSIIVPVYNEGPNIAWFYSALQKQLTSLKDYSFEVVFVDDGSSDDSMGTIAALAKKHSDVRYIQFSRNFGKEAATSAGLCNVKGDAAIMIDADGQHPVELIPEFLKNWRDGFDVVIGVRSANTDEGTVKRYGSKLFYALLNAMADHKSVPGSTDFRLLDQKVIKEFAQLTEHNRMTRGLIDWLGFKRTTISFTAPARHSGQAAYSYRKLLRLALHGFISHSTKPLQFTGLLGFFVTILALVTGLFLCLEQYVFGDPLGLHITGTALLALFLSFLVGLVLICQWLLALYVESIHSETQNRPLYIIADKSK